jgi:hypothetical protein
MLGLASYVEAKSVKSEKIKIADPVPVPMTRIDDLV